tara:strand:+ start:1655 stop:1918 length:264 start_codon:yes stop_codon:yes gene_type:complete
MTYIGNAHTIVNGKPITSAKERKRRKAPKATLKKKISEIGELYFISPFRGCPRNSFPSTVEKKNQLDLMLGRVRNLNFYTAVISPHF